MSLHVLDLRTGGVHDLPGSINDPSTPMAHFMVVFEEVTLPAAPSQGDGKKPQKRADNPKPARASNVRGARENARLKRELTATTYLQSIIEEQEASTEELKSANEEAQASNEELETAREELQSTNKKLLTLAGAASSEAKQD